MTAGADNPLLVERSGNLLTLTLNRPDRANALCSDLVERVIEEFDAAAPNGSLRADGSSPRLCVITGAGRGFCAGFDLGDLVDGRDWQDGIGKDATGGASSDAELLWRFLRVEHMLQLVHHAPFPVLVAAHRYAIGAGADLLAAASMRIATPETTMRMPGLNFELTLGTRRLTNLIGADAARDLLIDTRAVDAGEAQELGMVTEVAERDRWAEIIERQLARVESLPSAATAEMLALTRTNTRDIDLAAIVKSAGRPGLTARVAAYHNKSAEGARS